MTKTNEELVQEYKEGNKKALDELVAANQGIIKKIANKYNYINKNLEYDDLTQAGNIGLLKAIEKYDITLENSANFITYAVFYINRFILEEVNGKSSKEIENTKLNNNCISIYQPINNNDNDSIELLETIESDFNDILNADDRIYHEYLRNSLEQAMNESNTLLEREVLKFKCGWNSKRMTEEEVSEILNINNVKSINAKALRKLRANKWVRKYGIEMYMNDNSSYVSVYDNKIYNYIEKKVDLLA